MIPVIYPLFSLIDELNELIITKGECEVNTHLPLLYKVNQSDPYK